VRLIDSALVEDETGSEWVRYRVAVVTTRGEDTVPDIRANAPPLVLGDSIVTGVAYEGGTATGVFEYRLSTRRLKRRELPADVSRAFYNLALAPDARHLAYVADSADFLAAVVRAWPAGPLVARSPWARGYPSDVDFNHAHWSTADAFTVAFRAEDGQWIRLRGTVRDGRFRVDTLQSEPGPS
jgi:hypothetical protein